jgi:Family of unknown function (DUF6361)
VVGIETYKPESSFGWLDFDTAASERVATMLNALEEPGTLDPLGLGSVRDAFSDALSPGTSTIQTRLRYFIFIPWICSYLQEQRVAPSEFATSLRNREARLIDCLRHLGPNRGVIGYNAGRDLKRMPSEVYWGGLWSWGLRLLDLSISEYGKRAAAIQRSKPDVDDDRNVAVRGITMWASMPEPPNDFLDAEIDFELSRDEAEMLVDRVRERHPGSLLAALCDRPELAAPAGFPWQVEGAGLGRHLIEVLRHARCFSELTVGPQHLYNVLLARDARAQLKWDTDEFETDQLMQLFVWADIVEARHVELTAWVEELEAFWQLPELANAVTERTREFVRAMVIPAVRDPRGFVEDSTVQASIRTRETSLKAGRARLTSRAALENWNQGAFGRQLDYRWSVTQSYLDDIATALTRDV